MAVGRWQKGEFARETDPEEFKSAAPEAWAIAVRFLHRVQNNFSQTIPESECVSVMRYVI
jgi:transcriptional regulatory protein LevR